MPIAVLSGILFLSGVSALLFQTLWLRLSGLAFGNSVWSAALILSSFMAGLALGNAIAAWWRRGPRRPLSFYALLELTVGFFGCLLVFLLPHLGTICQPLFRALWSHQAILNVFRFAASFLILLIPTTAMGLTLPVLMGDAILARYQYGRVLGVLYGINTLGAVAGALAGELIFVRLCGLFGTALIAASFNFGAAAIAWFFSARSGPPDAAAPPTTVVNDRTPWLKRFLAGSFAAGALLLTLEIVWFRFLRLYLSSSPTAFAVMLAVVLAGIGSGGIVAGLIMRDERKAEQYLPICALAAGIVTLLSYAFAPTAYFQGADAGIYLERGREIAGLSFSLMFPPAFFSGIMFPLVGAAVQRRLARPTKSLGLVTLANTVGAAVGPLLASFIFLPTFGFQATLVGCGIAYATLALVFSRRENWIGWSGLPAWLLSAAVVVCLTFFPYSRAEQHFANSRHPYEERGETLVRKIEGTADTFQLLRASLAGEPLYDRLLTNGFSMSASAYPSQRYMRLFAYLPLCLRPEASDALLICYGVGETADALAGSSSLRRVEVVDISKEVFALAADESKAINPLTRKNVNALVQDGRFYLQAADRLYDIITGEPPPPKVAGSVNLYTQQFFELMRARLKDDGIATFWLPIYQLRVTEAKSILAAFHAAFPQMAVWSSGDEEWIMMGFKREPSPASEAALRQLFQDPASREKFFRVGIETPGQLAALFIMDGGEVERIAGSTPPLTDLFPKRLGDMRPDAKAIHNWAAPYYQADHAFTAFRNSRLMTALWPAGLTANLEGLFAVRETRYQAATAGTNQLAELDFYLRRTHLQVPIQEVLGSDPIRVAMAETIERSEGTATPPAIRRDLIAGRLSHRDYPPAIALLEEEQRGKAFALSERALLTYLYCLNHQSGEAQKLAMTFIPQHRQVPVVAWLAQKLESDFGIPLER